MLAYAILGTNDLQQAASFYDEIFAELGARRMQESERSIGWSSEQQPGMAVALPYDGKPAVASNGGMLSLACKSKMQLDALYERVLELGASDEGKPGYRHEGVYMAYWRDLDGNKMSFVFLS